MQSVLPWEDVAGSRGLNYLVKDGSMHIVLMSVGVVSSTLIQLEMDSTLQLLESLPHFLILVCWALVQEAGEEVVNISLSSRCQCPYTGSVPQGNL